MIGRRNIGGGRKPKIRINILKENTKTMLSDEGLQPFSSQKAPYFSEGMNG